MINGKEYTYYQCTQKQRSMERDIRALKREINACEALGMDSQELHSKLKLKMSEYRKFSDSANLKPKMNRLRVTRESVDLSKTKTMKYYDSLVKSNSHGIIKSGTTERVIGNDRFRITKSKFLKSEYKDIEELKHSLSDLDVRLWYKAKDAEIVNKIDKRLPLEEQAKKACELRNTYRTQARELMRNQEKRRQLDAEHPNKDFEALVKDKMERKGLSREEALKDIIDTSGKTNKKVDKSLGLE